MTPPHNPNRKVTILVMVITGLITLTLVVMRITTLGGDSPQTAFGKALIIVPSLIVILSFLFAISYHQETLLSHLINQVPRPTSTSNPDSEQAISTSNPDTEQPTSISNPDSEQGMLKMLQKIKELQAELNAVKTKRRELQDDWDSLFGPISASEVKNALLKMYSELETLRSAGLTEKLAQLQQEAKEKNLEAQQLTEKLGEISQQNEELLIRINQATLKIELLENHKNQLVQNAKQHTWREVNWEDFMASVNFGQDLLTDNRWGDRIRQRVRKEGLLLFGDPTVTSLFEVKTSLIES